MTTAYRVPATTASAWRRWHDRSVDYPISTLPVRSFITSVLPAACCRRAPWN
jgi:hypothetical protein